MKDICLIAVKIRRSDGTFYTLPTIKGSPGNDGKSAYQVALDNGFEGSEIEWLESLKQGPAGAADNSLQFIYYRTTDSAHPETPISVNIDNSIPGSWTAVPMGVTDMYKYEWVSLRTRVNGTWGVYSLPALWAIYGFGSTLPEIEIDDITGLSSILNELTDNQQHFIPKSYLFNPLHTKVASLNELNLLNQAMFPIATLTALGAIKVGPTLKINAETGVLDTDISFEDLTDSALAENKVDGAAVVWDETLGKYKNTLLSITGLFHPLNGKDTLNLRADVLRSRTLIIPKTPATPDANEVALHAIENGYSITDPEAFTGTQYLDDLNDVALAPLTLTDGDSLFKDGLNFVNKPAYTKDQITTLFNGLSRVYHPLNGRDYLDFIARDLRSRTLFIPTEDSSTGQVGVSIFAQENGYSIADPGEAINEFGELHDILALTWLNGQALLYRNGLFSNEDIYNKPEVNALIEALSLSSYYTKLEALQIFHPKFGLSGGNPLDLYADRLKSNTLLVPKDLPVLENTEVALHALENGYSILDPEAFISNFSQLDDISSLTWSNGQSIIFRDGLFSNRLIYDKEQIDLLLTNLDMTTYLKKNEAVLMYHPKFGMSQGAALDFNADRLKSNTLLISKEIPVLENTEVAIHAQENGYSLMDPEEFITNFSQLDDISNLIWTNSQSIIFRDGVFSNELIYNKAQVDILLANLDMTTYLKKTEATTLYHPKFGFLNETALDFTANRLKSSTLIIPKNVPVLENSEVGLHALENGYSIAEPSALGVTSLSTLEDVSLATPLANNEILAYSLASQRWINLLLSFNMFSDELSANSILVNDNRKFVSNAQIADWNSRWIYDEDTIKAIKVNAAIDSDKLGGIVAEDYWHVNNSNLYTVDWKAKVLRSRTLVVPKEVPIDLAINEVAIHALENGYSIVEPGGGLGATVLNDLDDVSITNPLTNHILFYNAISGLFTNDFITFDRINGTLDPARILTNAANRFVSDMQIIDWNSRESTLNKNVAGGYLGLNASAKIDFQFFPDIILGQVKYGGTFNAVGVISSPYVELNGENINAISAITYTGYYFISQADVTVVGIPTQTGDWIISNGAAGWAKVDNTDAVTSVNGRIGPITLTKSDVGLSNVDNTADSLKNVLSATKLFTARTLWGQSFDGTGNISGSLTNVTDITGSGILNMGAILIPKTLYPTIPNNTVAVHAVENGYSIYDPEAGSVGSLDDLSDVDLIARVDKQLFYYNSTLGKFTNGIIDFSYISGNLGADKITQSDSYRFVTATEKSRFQTAYDWGNHAIAGYLTTSVAASTYAAKSTTLSGYGISSSDTMFDGKYQRAYFGGATINANTINEFSSIAEYRWSNTPVNSIGILYTNTNYAPNWFTQDFHSITTNQRFFRDYNGSSATFSNWFEILHSGNFSSYADSAGAASTVQGNLNTHAGLTTTAHGLGASAFHSDSFFIQNQNASAQTGAFWINATTVIAKFSTTTPTSYAELHISNDVSANTVVGCIGSQYAGEDWAGSGYIYNNFQSHFWVKSVGDLGFFTGGLTLGHKRLSIDIYGAATFASTVSATGFNSTGAGQVFQAKATSGEVWYNAEDASGKFARFGVGATSDYAFFNTDYSKYGWFHSSVGNLMYLNSSAQLYGLASVAAISFIENGTALASKYLQLYSATSGYLPYWNGSSLANSGAFWDGTFYKIIGATGGSIVNRLGQNYTQFISTTGSQVTNIDILRNAIMGQNIGTEQSFLRLQAEAPYGVIGVGTGAAVVLAGTSNGNDGSYRVYTSTSGSPIERFTIQGGGNADFGFGGGRTEKLAVNGSFYANGAGGFNGALALFNGSSSNPNYPIHTKQARHQYLWIEGDGSYESMIRHSNSNGGWFVGMRTANTLSDYQFYSTIYGATVASLTEAGALTLNHFLKASSIKIGSSWEAIPNGSNGLDLKYGGVLKARLSSSGDILAVGGITCFVV